MTKVMPAVWCRNARVRCDRHAGRLADAGEFPNLTAMMEKRGWSEERIRKVMGGNWLRFLKEVWALDKFAL